MNTNCLKSDSVIQAAKDLRDDELLSFYHTEWPMFATTVAGLTIVFKHLDQNIGPIEDPHEASKVVGYMRLYINQVSTPKE